MEVTEGSRAALELLRSPGAEPPPGELLSDAAVATEACLLLALSDTTTAATLLAGGAASPTLAAVPIDVELSKGDTAAASRQLARWRPDEAQPLQVVEHAVCRAAVCAADGDVRGAESAVLDASRRRGARGNPSALPRAANRHEDRRRAGSSASQQLSRDAPGCRTDRGIAVRRTGPASGAAHQNESCPCSSSCRLA